MTSIRHFIIIILTLELLSSCDRCEKETRSWKTEAKILIPELKEVIQEISNNPDIFDSLKFDKNDLYLDNFLLNQKFHGNRARIPKLLAWFQKTSNKEGGRSYISFDKNTITANYKCCIYKSISYDAYLYHSKTGLPLGANKKGWKQSLEVIDSLDLGENWYYFLRRCDGCSD